MNNMSIININFINWEQNTSNGLVLLDFWADWCSACNDQDKVYQEISTIFPDKLMIGKIDVAENRFLADKFGVRNIPFLILLKDGKKVFQMPGIENKDYLINQIKKQII